METPGLGDGDRYMVVSQVHELDRLSKASCLELGFGIQGGSLRGISWEYRLYERYNLE